MNQDMRPVAVVRDRDAGEKVSMMGDLATIKVAGEDCGDRFALVEHVAPRGVATPLHAQPLEDETFYVLEGEIQAMLDGDELIASAGAVVHVPRGVSHAFRVISDSARLLSMHNPAGHERFFRAAAGEPPDVERFMAAAGEHNVEILGPPPWD